MPRTLEIEGLELRIFPARNDAELAAADRLADLAGERARRGLSCVLGLATGKTPIGIYRELVRRHRARDFSFGNVETFNLDEYWPIDLKARGSFHRFMHEHLFDHVDIPRGKRHVPNGSVPAAEIPKQCRDYEDAISRAGGIDLQLLGIGRNGHIGFNEPGSDAASRTRLVELTEETVNDNRADFDDPSKMPTHALTMGIATILEARELLVLAFGAQKAGIVRDSLRGPISPRLPASFLRIGAKDRKVTVFLDEAAAAGV